MEWLFDLIGPGHTELASTLVLYSFVIAAGIFLGKLKIGGISLGVTFVLFVGIIMGHFGYIVNPEVLKFVREFGLILVVYNKPQLHRETLSRKTKKQTNKQTPK